MEQRTITDPKPRRSASDLAKESAEKAASYRRKAVLAENKHLAKLSLALEHALAAAGDRDELGRVIEHVHKAQAEVRVVLDGLANQSI